MSPAAIIPLDPSMSTSRFDAPKPTSAAASASFVYKASFKFELLLADHGRERVDPTPQYKVVIPSVDDFAKSSDTQSMELALRTDKEILDLIKFWELRNGEWKSIFDSLRIRQIWKIGIAYNPFRVLRFGESNLGLHKLCSHWALYYYPAEEDEQVAVHSFLGMNFDPDGSISLEASWGTPHGWFRQLQRDKFRKHDKYPEFTIYADLSELILEAQLVLHLASRPTNGEYKLWSFNCQHFAAALYLHFKDQHWDDENRMETKFSLIDMAHHILGELASHEGS